jgi:3-oxoacyl-[acyl-carrier-protein] synthase II
MMTSNTIAITRMGIICALGHSPVAITRKLLKGESGVKKVVFQTGTPAATVAKILSAVPTVTPNHWPINRATALALQAAHAILPRNGTPPSTDLRLGLIHASAYGNLHSLLQYRTDMYKFGLNRASPMQFPNTILHAAASYLSVDVGASAFNLTLSNQSLSGMDALETACQLMAAGSADRVVVVTSEALSQELLSILKTTDDLDWDSPDPFGAKRAGYVPGEAAVAMILEPVARAQISGGLKHAVLLGSSGVSWGPRTIAVYEQTMRTALSDAQLSAADIGCVMANANGSPLDEIEARAIAAVFGDQAPVTSVKGAVGECAAAGSLLSIATAILCAQKGYHPPTKGRSKYDHRLSPINLLRKKTRVLKPVVMVNGFSGDIGGCQVWHMPTHAGTA